MKRKLSLLAVVILLALFMLIVNAEEQTNFDQGNISTQNLGNSSAVNKEVKSTLNTIKQEEIVENHISDNSASKGRTASASFGVYLNIVE